MKTCCKCGIDKPLTDFYVRKDAPCGVRSKCKECYKIEPEIKSQYDKQYYLINKAEKDAKAIQYYHANKDKKKFYDNKNKEKVLAQRRERYRNDIAYKLTCNLRCRLYTAMKRDKKCAHTLELLGCSASELRTYIQSLFTNGMSWDALMNGEIHIDHIKPCALFDLSDAQQQRECFHYSNLQPLWADDNRKKYKKFSE